MTPLYRRLFLMVLLGMNISLPLQAASIKPSGNLWKKIPEHIPKELFQTIVQSNNVRIERIVSKGQASPQDFWYDQEENEWVLVLKGHAGLRFQKEPSVMVLAPGDFVTIPAHQKHRVAWTTPKEETVWLAIFYKN